MRSSMYDVWNYGDIVFEGGVAEGFWGLEGFFVLDQPFFSLVSPIEPFIRA